MKQLEKTIGIKGIEEFMNSNLIKRTKNICMYLREDGAYEVFIAKTEKAKEIKGVKFEAREVYPKNEDFGSSAWSFWKREDLANLKYEELIKANPDQ